MEIVILLLLILLVREMSGMYEMSCRANRDSILKERADRAAAISEQANLAAVIDLTTIVTPPEIAGDSMILPPVADARVFKLEPKSPVSESSVPKGHASAPSAKKAKTFKAPPVELVAEAQAAEAIRSFAQNSSWSWRSPRKQNPYAFSI